MWLDVDIDYPVSEPSAETTVCTHQAVDGPHHWHALLAVPGSERRACIWLKRECGLKPYWPRYQTEFRLQRRSKIQWRSVIPGYIFLPAPVNYRKVESGPKIRRFLRNGTGDVAQIPYWGKQGIEEIIKIEASLNANPIAARDGIPFKKDQMVRIIPLEISGKILRIDSRRRVVILVDMFGGTVPLTVAVGDIESV